MYWNTKFGFIMDHLQKSRSMIKFEISMELMISGEECPGLREDLEDRREMLKKEKESNV